MRYLYNFLLSIVLILSVACAPLAEAPTGNAPGNAESSSEMLDEVTVAYFLEWPTPHQVAQWEKTYDEAMGVNINWVPFESGVAIAAAMASGDVDMAYSQGLVPFANAVSAGIPIKLVSVAVSYSDNDNCVASTASGITADNATDLYGQKASIPVGTVSHYKMLKQMEHLGVDVEQIDLIDLSPADGAAAIARGDVALACGWGGALRRMKDYGDVLMTGAEMEEIGLRVYSVISATDDFAANHGDLITTFLRVTEDANLAYKEDPASKVPTIAQAAGMSEEDAEAILALMVFPTAEEQLSAMWMDGEISRFTKEVADFFVEQGEVESALDDYSGMIDPTFLQNALNQ